MSTKRETSRRLWIGTRGSPLARWQATWVAEALKTRHPGLDVELVEIRTRGDHDRNSPLARIGGQGLFTKEIQAALLDRRVDVAVHSLKDLPTRGPAGLILAAVPPREESADALISPRFGTLDRIPPGGRIGTGSLRRRAQLLHLRPDLEVVDLRGNVETRLRRAIDGPLDAVVVAEAGLRRLGLDHHITERLTPPCFLPAVGQGALGIECRAGDPATATLLRTLDDPATHLAVRAERALLDALRGGCVVPLGAWARVVPTGLALDAAVLDVDGKERLSVALESGGTPEQLGRLVAETLHRQGADRFLPGASATG